MINLPIMIRFWGTALLIWLSACSESKDNLGENDIFSIHENMKEYIINNKIAISLDTTICSWYISHIDPGADEFRVSIDPCDSLLNQPLSIDLVYYDPNHPEGLHAQWGLVQDTCTMKKEYFTMATCFGDPIRDKVFTPLPRYHVSNKNLYFEYVSDSSCVADSISWKVVQSKAWAWINKDEYMLGIWYSDSIEHIDEHNENFRRILKTIRVLD